MFVRINNVFLIGFYLFVVVFLHLKHRSPQLFSKQFKILHNRFGEYLRKVDLFQIGIILLILFDVLFCACDVDPHDNHPSVLVFFDYGGSALSRFCRNPMNDVPRLNDEL